MAIVNDINLLIYECEKNGMISLDTRNEMLSAMESAVFEAKKSSDKPAKKGVFPLRKHLEKLKEIKDTKPSEYDGPAEIKKYVDKNYADIEKICKILEKEPAEIRKTDITFAVSWVSGFLVYCGSIIAVPFAGAAALTLAVISAIWVYVTPVIWLIISYIKQGNMRDASKDLDKIRRSLIKCKSSDLPKEYEKKVNTLITVIDDAQTEVSSKVRLTKESVQARLDVYDSFERGEISEADKRYYLARL